MSDDAGPKDLIMHAMLTLAGADDRLVELADNRTCQSDGIENGNVLGCI